MTLRFLAFGEPFFVEYSFSRWSFNRMQYSETYIQRSI